MRALDLSPVRASSGISNEARRERVLIFDTETTGLGAGHRVIEIGVVEIVNRKITGREFHAYINPERSIDADAEAVHGLSQRFLADKPKFHEIADEFLRFLGDEGDLVAHNATFDVNKLNDEFKRMGVDFRVDDKFNIVDTMKMSRKAYPGQRATMDALCDRLGVSRHERQVSGLHGALIDSRILSRVYLAMTAGQVQIGYSEGRQVAVAADFRIDRSKIPTLKIVYANSDEESAHARLCDAIEKSSGGYCCFRGKWAKPEKPENATMEKPNAAEFGSGTAAPTGSIGKPGLSHLIVTSTVQTAPAAEKSGDRESPVPAQKASGGNQKPRSRRSRVRAGDLKNPFGRFPDLSEIG